MSNIKTSAKFHFDTNDWEKWLHDFMKYFIPVGVAALGAVAKEIPTDWVWGGTLVFLISMAINWLTKWAAANNATVTIVKTPETVITTTTETVKPPVTPPDTSSL